MHRVEDVTLADSEKEPPEGGSQTGSSSSTPDSAQGNQDCDPHHYKFDVSVSFKPAPATSAPDGGAKRVPGRLGGGA